MNVCVNCGQVLELAEVGPKCSRCKYAPVTASDHTLEFAEEFDNATPDILKPASPKPDAGSDEEWADHVVDRIEITNRKFGCDFSSHQIAQLAAIDGLAEGRRREREDRNKPGGAAAYKITDMERLAEFILERAERAAREAWYAVLFRLEGYINKSAQDVWMHTREDFKTYWKQRQEQKK